MRMLVFDDDAAVGRLVARVATLLGMQADSVTDDIAFRQHLDSDPPQVVVLDMQLSGTDGIEQMRVLAHAHYAGALVLISGFDPRVLNTARAIGLGLGLRIEHVLEKPLDVDVLRQVLERLQTFGRSLSAERLLDAIAGDELSLDFQPVVTRKPRTLKKLEALIRWEHPVLGRIPPGDFLAVAEGDTRVIDALTEWIMSAAVEAYQVLGQLGVSVPLSANISPRNLHDLTFPERLEQRLRDGNMPAPHLCLEITESVAFDDAARTMDVLSRIRLKGMQLSIDDFGTGFSSLKLLLQMPFSEIKIDRSFVSSATTSRDSATIVKSLIDLAANMKLACVAEGVETEATADLIERLGPCDLQGFFIARPMPVEAVPAWLAIWLQDGAATAARPATDRHHTMPPTRGEADASRPNAAAVRPDPGGTAARLSPRQLEVMQAVSEGCSVKEIARRLDISPATVKVHLSLAYSALGARNRVEAVTRAGLWSGPDMPAGAAC